MAKNTKADLSTTPANNADFLGQSTAGSANANTIDTIVQNFAAIEARAYGDVGGQGTVGGTADAITLASLSTYQTLTPGLQVKFKASGTNTGAVTLNLDSLGARAVRRQGDAALVAGDIAEDGYYDLVYDTDYNETAGGWVLLNPTVSGAGAASTTEALTGTDAAKYVTPDALAALWEKGSDIASASTITIGEGGFFHVTGTTTITDIDWSTPKDGRGAWIIFDGALTLTHNSTTLKLPGGANITTAAGDRAYFVQDASDNVVCLLYQRADGTPLASATVTSMTLLETLTTTGSPTVTSSAIPSTYRAVYVEVALSSTNNTSVNAIIAGSTNGSAFGSFNTLFSMGTGNASTTFNAAFQILGIRLSLDRKRASGWGGSTAPAVDALVEQNASGALTHLRFGVSAGDIDVCNIAIYGVK